METSVKRKYLKYPLMVLRAVGLWRGDNENISYSVYGFFVIFTSQYLYATTQIIYIFNVWGDIEKVAEASFLLLTQINLCNKIAFFSFKMGMVRKLTKFMDGDIFRPQNEHQWTILNSSSKEQVIEFFIFSFVSSATIATWAVFPFIDVVPGEKVLPFKAWYPMPENESPYYELLYFYQIFGIYLSACCNVSLDRIFTAMLATGCAQIEILKDNLINVEVYAIEDFDDMNARKMRIISESPKLKIVNINEKINEIEELMRFRLIRCVKHHKHIVDFVKEAEDIFSVGLLGQFGASVGIICITGLQITLINPLSMKFFTKVTYMVTMLAQIFFLCRIGNEITYISMGISEVAYAMPWPDRHRRFKTSVLIFMERLKQPIITRAGNLFPLSFQTFVSILRSSYSYFAVLQQLNSK